MSIRTMTKWYDESKLELVEMIAEDACLIASEEELSERFDNEIVDEVIKQYGESDQCAINEEFNNWADMLCKDGEIHPEQYANYCYVGEYSE